VQVASSADDTWVANGVNWPLEPHLIMGGAGQYHVGLRFPCLQVPRGATINSAKLWVTSVLDTAAPLDVSIYAHAIDDALTFPAATWSRAGRGRATAWRGNCPGQRSGWLGVLSRPRIYLALSRR